LAEVRVQEGEPLENALRRFKRKVQQEDIIKEVKRHWPASGIARKLAKKQTSCQVVCNKRHSGNRSVMQADAEENSSGCRSGELHRIV
jgi:ribosomal protein S21